MDNAVWRVFLLPVLLALSSLSVAQSIEVEIQRASEISRDPAIVEAQRLIGDVALTVGEAEVVCDSAWRYPTGRFRLMGQVEAVDGAAVLTGDRLELLPDSGIGRMTGRVVRLVDHSDPNVARTLTTERTTYDFRSGIARFSDGGVVTTETERIESRSGWYDQDAGAMEFNGGVVMIVDTVDIRSETVRYRPEDKMLNLPVSAEVLHPGGGIVCSRGQWSMQSETGWFVGRGADQAQFLDGELVVLADSLAMGDSLGLAFGRVAMRDTATTYRLVADTVRFGRGEAGVPEASEVAMSGHAVAWLYEGQDPLRVSAPGMDITDGAKGRSLLAWSGAVLHFGDVTAAANSLT